RTRRWRIAIDRARGHAIARSRGRLCRGQPVPAAGAGDRRRVRGLRRGRAMRGLTYNEAALEAIAEGMRRDEKIFYMSTDAIPSLLEEFGDKRIKATPITEAAFTGIGIGAAGCGFRPIVDWRQVTFCFVAMDQIVNQAAKIHYMFGGQVTF